MANTKSPENSHGDGSKASGDLSRSRLLSWPQVQEILNGRSYHSVLRDEKKGHFPGRVRIGKRQVRWITDEIETWLENLKKNRGTRPSESDED